jgi:hypothetical protein
MYRICLKALVVIFFLIASCVEQDPLVKLQMDFVKGKIDKEEYHTQSGKILREKYAEEITQTKDFISYLSNYYTEHGSLI